VKLKDWCNRHVLGVWNANKLLSRKFWLAAGSVIVAVTCSLAGREIGSDTLSYMGIVVPAYLAVEGALDWAWKRKQRKDEEV